MKVIKLTFTIIAVFMAVTLILKANNSSPSGPPGPPSPASKPVATVRVSRFLQENEKSPRAADHCKDNDVCNNTLEGGRNATCCNNKCMDLEYDDNNCGNCKTKCAFTETCCRGECVDNSYDKRHCGSCNNKCMEGGYCIYGMCDYA